MSVSAGADAIARSVPKLDARACVLGALVEIERGQGMPNSKRRSRAKPSKKQRARLTEMIWSPDTIATLDETALRTDVLIPLFESMSYQGVYHHHGGAAELGKDLVMWKDDPATGRLYYSVVAKAGAIRGGIASRVMQTTLNQIRQTFGAAYNDPNTHERRSVSRCFVIASGSFPKESKAAIRAALGDPLQALITTYDGSELWKLIEEHLSVKLVQHRIHSTVQFLNSANPDWAIDLSIRGKDVFFNVIPKTFDPPPLNVSVTPRFPETPAGQEAKTAYEAYQALGSEVTLDASMIADIRFPDFLRLLLPREIAEITLFGRFLIPHPLVINVTVRSTDGSRAFDIPAVVFSVGQGGTQEISLTNEPQATPFKFTLHLPRTRRGGHFNLRFAPEGHNIYRQWQAIQVQQILAGSAEVQFHDAETGRLLLGAHSEGGGAAPSRGFVAIVEKILAIQNMTGNTFTLPDNLSQEELLEIDSLHSVLTTGSALVSELNAVAHPGGAKNILANVGDQPGSFLITKSNQMAPILGQLVELGPVEVRCKKAIIPPDDRQRLANARDDEEVSFRLVPTEGESMEARYLNWPKTDTESGAG